MIRCWVFFFYAKNNNKERSFKLLHFWKYSIIIMYKTTIQKFGVSKRSFLVLSVAFS